MDLKPECRLSGPRYAASVITLIISVFGIVAAGNPMVSIPASDPIRYAIMFDGGSTGTRMYILKWDATKTRGWGNTPNIEEMGNCYPPNVFANFENNPSAAGPNLQTCLNQAKTTIPQKYYNATTVYLGATTSMRALNARNSAAANAILNSVQSTLATYPFQLGKLKILTEVEDGLYGWMAYNFFNVKFNFMKDLRGFDGTVGLIDMGSSAMQITFSPGADETGVQTNYTMTAQLFGSNYLLYTNNFLCYGMAEAYLRVLVQSFKDSGATADNTGVVNVPFPCAPRSAPISRTYRSLFDSSCTQAQANTAFKANNFTFTGTGDMNKCGATLQRMFDKSQCTFQQCSFNGVYQPRLKGAFLALDKFFSTYEFYNFTDFTTLEKLQTSVQTFCNMAWADVIATNAPGSALAAHCFEGQYIIAVLKALGFDSKTWTDLVMLDSIGEAYSDWTPGLLIAESNTMTPVPTIMVPCTGVTMQDPYGAWPPIRCSASSTFYKNWVFLVFFAVVGRKV